MERNEDLRRATVSGFSGLQRRRQGTAAFRDSREENRQMELQEMVRLRDREPLQKKDGDREFSKRRKVDRQQRTGGGDFCRENESTESSDEEYYEDEDEALRIHRQNRMNQSPPPPSIRSNNRRSLRTLRSSPVLRAVIDEMIGVPIPRRARSTSNKRLHGLWSSGSGGFGEDLNLRRFSKPPATESPSGPDGLSPSSSGGSSMMKRMKYVEPRTRTLSSASNSRPRAVIQDDIEFEVAEALFDMMKHSQFSKNIDRDGTNTNDVELKKLKAESRRDESGGAFSVQNEQLIRVDAEAVTVDPMEEELAIEENIQKEKFSDDQVQELLCLDEFLSKGKAVSPRESESPSCVKVNACKFQDLTVTKADSETILVETKKESRIDLMAPLALSSFREKGFLVDTASNSGIMIEDVQEMSETMKNGPPVVSMGLLEEKSGTTSSSQLPNLDAEKDACVIDGSKQHQWGLKEQTNISPNSLLPFPIPLNGWPGVPPHPGYMTPLQAVLPMDASPRSSIAVQPPQFKFSQPRSRRCTTHQHIALNIHSHQQLFKKAWSVPTGSTNFFGMKQLNLYSKSAEQKIVPEILSARHCNSRQNLANHSGGSGKDKSSEVAKAMNTLMSNKLVPQQAVHEASAHKYLHGPALTFPLGHHQAPANASGPPQSSSAVVEASVPSSSALNLCLPAMSFNHQNMSTKENVAPYMAILQKNGSPFPIPPNITLQKNGSQVPVVPFFSPSFYSSSVFNQSQQHLSLPNALVQSTSQNTSTPNGSSSRKPPIGQNQTSANINDSRSSADVGRNYLMSSSGQLFSTPVRPMNAVGPKNGDPQQKGSMGRVDLIPQALTMSFGSNPALNFHMLPDMTQNGYQKYFQASEGQRVVGSTNLQDGLKGTFVKSESNGAQSLNFTKLGCSDLPAVSTMGASMFDGSSGNINVVPYTLTGKQAHPSQSGVSVTIPNLHQQHQQHQQLIQLQKHHMQQMQQLNGVKDGIPGSLFRGSSPSNDAIFMRTDASSYTSQWENFPQQLKSSQGQTHISFGNMPVSSASFQGQHMVSQSCIPKNMVGGSVPSQQADVSPNGPSQKSSPACRRNVPSILSTCPSQPSELKY